MISELDGLSKFYLRKLLSSSAWIQFNVHLARMLGINEALIISFLIYKEEHLEENGNLENWEQDGERFDSFFPCSQKEIEERTTLSSFQQSKALGSLEEKDLIKICRKGAPPRNFFRLNGDGINELFKNQETSFSKTKKLSFQK